MSIKTISDEDFTRDPQAARTWATEGPVIITEHGRPTYVLLKLPGIEHPGQTDTRSLLELMDSMPRTDGIAYDLK
jgi:hypothetical protein